MNKRLIMGDITDSQMRVLQGQTRFGVQLLEAIANAESTFERFQQREA